MNIFYLKELLWSVNVTTNYFNTIKLNYNLSGNDKSVYIKWFLTVILFETSVFQFWAKYTSIFIYVRRWKRDNKEKLYSWNS